MSEWWTYRLSDFLMFSPETYHRLFQLYNQDVWPIQLVLLAIGLALVSLVRQGDERSDRIAMALLAGCWLLVAWLFHWLRFREIHLAGGWLAGAFLLQSALLLIPTFPRWSHSPRPARLPGPRVAALGVLLFGVVLQPLIGPVLGRSWEAIQSFGLTPDPTVTATLGVLLATRSRWYLWPIPVMYSLLSSATLWTMESTDALVPVLTALMTIVGCIFSPNPQPSRES